MSVSNKPPAPEPIWPENPNPYMSQSFAMNGCVPVAAMTDFSIKSVVVVWKSGVAAWS
jgi:hypothetical protein